MQLDLRQIQEIVTGAVRTEQTNGAVRFYRFTEEQETLYKNTKQLFYNRSFSTAGVKLLFQTDSIHISFKVNVEEANAREYFSFDITVNGQPVGYIDNFSDGELPQPYVAASFPLGVFSKSFYLGEGVKTVCVHFPWSVRVAVEEITLDDGASIKAIKPTKKLLAFGDSITHGFDALRPSCRYIAKIAEKLGAAEYNKAMGGEMFFPPLAELEEAFQPDYITIAYGTNDWNGTREETFNQNCEAFYRTVREKYPQAKIFAITPIWRRDLHEEREFGPFENVERNIRRIAGKLKNITVLSGFDCVPTEERFYADYRLHPNDEGFTHYAENLYAKMKINL